MRIRRPADGTLVIQVRPGVLEYALGIGGLTPALGLLLEGPSEQNPIWLSFVLPAFVAFLLSFFVEFSAFVFDGPRRELRWSRRTAWQREAGTVPFGEITCVRVDSHERSDGGQVHRVCIDTPAADHSPTRYFSTGAQSAVVARAIREYLAAHGSPLGY